MLMEDVKYNFKEKNVIYKIFLGFLIVSQVKWTVYQNILKMKYLVLIWPGNIT